MSLHRFIPDQKTGDFSVRYGEVWEKNGVTHAQLTNLHQDDLGHEEFATMEEAIAWLHKRMAEAS